MTKSLFKSKTFYLGLIEVAIGLLNYLQGELANGHTLTGMGIATIIIRLFTNQAVKIK